MGTSALDKRCPHPTADKQWEMRNNSKGEGRGGRDQETPLEDIPKQDEECVHRNNTTRQNVTS
jgi:hypothetical protein